jgi:hypothetical protein
MFDRRLVVENPVMKRVALGAAVLASGMLAGCAQLEAMHFVAQAKNKPATDFELEALDGGQVRLGSYTGQPVVLAFWAYG